MGSPLDRLLPTWHARSAHQIDIAAPVERVDAALRELDLSRSWPCRVLFRMRGLPTRWLTLSRLTEVGFVPLMDRPGALTYGLIGRFWRPSGQLQRFAPEEFVELMPAGFAKAAWSFVVEPAPGGCRALTETRILGCDEAARRSFLRYWRIVGPFSGWIRREALRILRAAAER